ncbi:hypothetical protein MO973_13405 [Paenibacillus sp. TRM 82003]|nr:hypothetical protein [Paenibacillus sp. TRM 82003]
MDCDRNEENCGVEPEELKGFLQQSLENETELLRVYTILAERIHDNDELKDRLHNFAEGNAKRSRQLQEELEKFEQSDDDN